MTWETFMGVGVKNSFFDLASNVYNKFNSKQLLFVSPKTLTFLFKGWIYSVTRLSWIRNLLWCPIRPCVGWPQAHFLYLMLSHCPAYFFPLSNTEILLLLPSAHAVPCVWTFLSLCLPGFLLIQCLLKDTSTFLSHLLQPLPFSPPTPLTIILYCTTLCTSL